MGEAVIDNPVKVAIRKYYGARAGSLKFSQGEQEGVRAVSRGLAAAPVCRWLTRIYPRIEGSRMVQNCGGTLEL